MCKTNNKKIEPGESSFAHKMNVSWLYYGKKKIRDTFVYEYTLQEHERQGDIFGIEDHSLVKRE